MIQLNIQKPKTKVHKISGYFELDIECREDIKFNPSDLKITLGTAYFSRPRKKKKLVKKKIKDVKKPRRMLE